MSIKKISYLPTKFASVVFAIALLSANVAFALPDIAPGSPEGSCCRVGGVEGSSKMRTNPPFVWTCSGGSIAFKGAAKVSIGRAQQKVAAAKAVLAQAEKDLSIAQRLGQSEAK